MVCCMHSHVCRCDQYILYCLMPHPCHTHHTGPWGGALVICVQRCTPGTNGLPSKCCVSIFRGCGQVPAPPQHQTMSAKGIILHLLPSPFPPPQSCSYCYLPQYLGRTHNYWHGAALLLEEKASGEGELSNGPPRGRVPPIYNGNYADDLLDPLKNVRCHGSSLVLLDLMFYSQAGDSGLTLRAVRLDERRRPLDRTMAGEVQVRMTWAPPLHPPHTTPLSPDHTPSPYPRPHPFTLPQTTPLHYALYVLAGTQRQP